MKLFLTLIFSVGFLSLVQGQSISSTNSGANSSNNLIYAVGEIFVVPDNQNDASSGIIGAVSIIEFFILGINEVVPSEEIIFYPNPTKNIVYIGTKNIIHKIFIYDVNGKFISERSVSNNQVNIQDLRNGIYFIKPNNSNLNSFKIIKN